MNSEDLEAKLNEINRKLGPELPSSPNNPGGLSGAIALSSTSLFQRIGPAHEFEAGLTGLIKTDADSLHEKTGLMQAGGLAGLIATNPDSVHRRLGTAHLFDNGMTGLVKTQADSLHNKLGDAYRTASNTVEGLIQRVDKLSKRLRLPEIINALTLIVVLHNAAMLSRSLVQSLGELLSMGMAVIGLKDEDDNPYDVNQIVGKQIDQWIVSILGQDVWNNVKATWNNANRTYQSAANIISSVRSISDSTREVLEFSAENTGKIGNALKRAGVVNENAYPFMPENVDAGTDRQRRFDRVMDGLENAENVVSSLSSVTSEVVSIQEEFQQFKKNKEDFENSVKTLAPDTPIENDPIADAVASEKEETKPPEIKSEDEVKPES